MFHTRLHFLPILLIIALLLTNGLLVSPVQAQDGIQFSPPELINQFPDQLTVRSTVVSSDQDIIRAEIAYSRASLYSPESYTVEEIELTPGNEVNLEYTIDTRDLTTPPMMSYLVRWELELADGTDFTSETFRVQYTDTRYDWQVLENDLIAVWWHDKPAEFGQAVFDIASQAIQRQTELFQINLENQLLVVINNSPEEFASWHNLAYDWVGGETFNNYGITVQIVSSSDPADSWLYGVIPHEISHIFFAQATHNPTVSIPVWLNEGLAQYNELGSQDWVLQTVQDAAKNGELIPLHNLARGFGAHNTERVYLAYAESLSAVNYLVEQYGTGGLASLLAAYQEGFNTEDAFPQALEISADQFELDWAASLGAEGYSIATPPPLPTFPPSPTPGAANFSGPTPTPQPVTNPAGKSLPICSSLFGLLGIGLIAGWKSRQSSK
ncbi:MAG: peptidase MA family metallohydrolase [Anaerolineales bacterium]